MSLALHEALSRDVYRKKDELARLMDCSTRDVEHQIEHARKTSRLPIMSGSMGYRLARNPEEYSFDVARRHKRALVQLVTVQGEKTYLDRWRAYLSPPPAKPEQEALPWASTAR